MQIDDATPHAGPESEYLWFRDGSPPDVRADRLAEAIALVALLFSLAIGLVIAMLPVSDKAAAAAEVSLVPPGTPVAPSPRVPRAGPGGVDRG